MTENNERQDSTRADEFKHKSSNPCKKFYTWSSEEKCFMYYDKEKKEKVKVDIPIRFIHLKELNTIKGWHEASNSGIFSNEVVNLAIDDLSVRAFKGGDIIKGIYKNIKPDIVNNGGYYTKSIYVIDGTGELINISLKGSGVRAWSDFLEEKGRDRLLNEWVIVKESKDMKKGAVSYSIPVFDFLKELNSDENEEANDKYREFMDYFLKYTTKTEKIND